MTWVDLYERHEAARDLGDMNLATELRKRIKTLAAQGYCDAVYQGRLTDKPVNKLNHRVEVRVTGDKTPVGDPISLLRLPQLVEPALYIHAVADTRRRRVLKYTIRLDAQWQVDGAPFTVSIELGEAPEGRGACGHPLLHCHAGVDHARTPQFRLPLPPLKPWEALDWLIAQLDPTTEPLPWKSVPGTPQAEEA